MKKAWLAIILALTSVSVAQAGGILEIRGGVGMAAADSDDFEDQTQAIGGQSIDANDFETYNADIFINLPALPIGFGVRHEWLNLNEGSGNNEVDLEATNLSLLVDLRIIDSDNFYVGPIVGIGHPSAKVDFKSGAVSVDDHIDGDTVSYLGGLEAGVYLGHFLIGAEAGYQNIKFEDNDSSSGVNASIDASGFYGKAMVGLTFF